MTTRPDKMAHPMRNLCFLLVLLAYLSAGCFAQTITVRIINVSNKKPVKNVPIYVYEVGEINESRAKVREEARKLIANPPNADMKLRTDANGEAILSFGLANNAAASFYIRALLPPSHWDSCCLVHIITEEVIEKGLVTLSPYAYRRPKPSISPKPGEILLDLRPLPLYVRVLWPLLKG
jgi:hypothetical protein